MELEDMFCPNCCRPYLRFAQSGTAFCICNILITISIIPDGSKKVSVPKVFYDAFEGEEYFYAE